MKILFVCRKRGPYGYLSSGLFNSVKFLVDMLDDMGIDSRMVDVVNNNQIDKEVKSYQPTHVIIEALWVVPKKFKVLMELYPNVEWVVRLHSDIPFLANEGIAFEWLFEYITKGVTIASNKESVAKLLTKVLRTEVKYLPNYYPVTNEPFEHGAKHGDTLNVGCFGAIRPLKNQLAQAFAAIRFADEQNRRLRFHMNVGRVEACGETIERKIRAVFKNLPGHHELITHKWYDHDEFTKLCKKMNVGMQVSFSETYNLVTADFVNVNVPVVVSSEVRWVSKECVTSPNNIESIVKTMSRVFNDGKLVRANRELLIWEDVKTKTAWAAFSLEG